MYVMARKAFAAMVCPPEGMVIPDHASLMRLQRQRGHAYVGIVLRSVRRPHGTSYHLRKYWRIFVCGVALQNISP